MRLSNKYIDHMYLLFLISIYFNFKRKKLSSWKTNRKKFYDRKSRCLLSQQNSNLIQYNNYKVAISIFTMDLLCKYQTKL